ncbi:MAG: hypothetical protein P4L53_04435 [Candidatus Obscuribacterales bacterium]|nr:hypothetical protein [Candidatus Obscuribacterales bacterium]
MHKALTCPNCGAPTAARDDATISDALIASGTVILVCGINYAKFEEFTRPVFSQMPSNFENHFGACFARYQSGGSHNHDFTLVVVGEGNDKIALLLQELLPRLKHIVVFGPKTDEESALLLDGTKMPTSSVFITPPGIEGTREYFAIAMHQAVKEAKF